MESKSKPDFLFSGAACYRDECWPFDRLTMLRVKTSCKNRWRQVLNEAHRIPEKHLMTLQPRISKHQTDEMKSAGLNLVLPKMIQSSYTDIQQGWLIDVSDFIKLARERQ